MRRAPAVAAGLFAAAALAAPAGATVRLLGSTPSVGRSQLALIMIGAAGKAHCSLELPSALRAPGVTVPPATPEPAGELFWNWRVSSRLGSFTARIDCGVHGSITVPIDITLQGGTTSELRCPCGSLPVTRP
jgi:hypothetical protein